MSEQRSARLQRLLNDVLRAETIISQRNAKQFLEAVCADKAPSICISKIVASSSGLAALQAALSSDSSLAFINTSLTTFIQYIQAPDLQTLCGGDVLRQIFDKVVEAPLVWQSLTSAARSQTLDSPALGAFAWLLIQLLSLPAEDAVAYLPIAQDATIQKSLLQSEQYDHRVQGQRLVHIAQTLAGLSQTTRHASAPDAPGPGGRHDNDFAEIQKISIYPTADELNTTDVYLPLAAEVQKRAGDLDGLAMHIDAQFRLLRDDMLRELREEIKSAQDPKSRRRKPFLIHYLALTGVNHHEKRRWALELTCTNDLPQFKQLNPDQRANFLKENYKFLKHGSLAALLFENEVISLGTLVREKDRLIMQPSVICIEIPMSNIEAVLLRLKSGFGRISLLQVDAAMFSYEPVLKQLKETRELSLSEEILTWQSENTPQPPAYTLSGKILELFRRLQTTHDIDLQPYLSLDKSIKLDKAQSNCFRVALEQRVAVMQGPPGTGKSFIGSLVGKTIYSASKEQILVVCYTHHALDDFINDLLDLGIPKKEIVRLGSNQKSSQRIKDLALFDQSRNIRFTSQQHAMLDKGNADIRESGQSLHNVFQEFIQFNPRGKEILEYLEFLDDETPFYEAFQIPKSDDGMTRVGKGNKAVNPFYLFERWIKGKDAGMFAKDVHLPYKSVWSLSLDIRQQKCRYWVQDLLREHIGTVREQGKRYNSSIERINSVFLEKDLAVMRGKRIIACTTTAAAKYSEALQNTAPGVLLVEEAGEILESHILTALGPKTKHLILIGDHKQLRPKCDYDLSVEKGTGYDLNRSLFERLILNGFPHQTLFSQHRMRPEISALVRELTYPDLTDAEKTKGRLDLRGFTDNLVFVNHDQTESELAGFGHLNDTTSKSSKQNLFEAQMTLKCIRYLAQQGYRTDNMVVLTPYLGQLKLLLEQLKNDTDPVLGDIDSHDLVKAGLMPAATANVNKGKLRVSTIDNYQGEEADIVVISLTRSNKNNDIGFMYAPERLNVLLSRARNAMIIIGNAEHFMSSRKGGELWTRFITMLKAKNHIYEGFPVRCERHPDRVALLKNPADFDAECPDGGCNEPCESMLNCNLHKCTSKCHVLVDHSKIKCAASVEYPCPQGHKVRQACFQSVAGIVPRCDSLVETKCDKGHLRRRKCWQPDDQICNQCQIQDEKIRKDAEKKIRDQDEKQQHLLRMAELDRELQAIQDQHDRDQAMEDRKAAFQQKQNDLENARTAQTKKTTNQADAKSKSTGDADNSKPSTKKQTSKDEESHNPAPIEMTGAAKDWEHQKTVEGASNDAIDSLMSMTGLEDVKSKVLDIKAKIEVAKRQDMDIKKERFGVTMLGNPGTGKTTVARIYARFLCSVGALPGSGFEEVSGSSLANDGVNGAKQKIEQLVKAGGGVFFLDEAYQLASGNSYQGKAVLDFLLTEIEERRGEVVFILAGYHKEMEKFFEHNPGFDSRMPNRLIFKDYTDSELLKMLEAMIRKKYKGKARLAGGYGGLYNRILTRRLGRRRGSPGYGNARDLENIWSQVTERQARRLKHERQRRQSPDDYFFSQSDLIGPEPSVAVRQSSAWKKLHDLTGLDSVKLSVQSFAQRVQLNYHRELQEKEPISVSLNRLFLGSPGTGKTTVAKLYGAILAEIGLLSKGEVVLKTPADFIGSVIGESEKNTQAILKASEGKVLLIDEAYSLNPALGSSTGKGSGGDPFKTAVIDTIVAEVQSVPGEDRCVILVGYTDMMRDLLRNANPGLSRRFPDDSAFHFQDFTDAQLREIMNFKLKSQGTSATDEAKDVAIGMLARARDRPNFGNAGEVENLLSRAKDAWQKRVMSGNMPDDQTSSDVVFEAEDFDPEYDRAQSSEVSVQSIFADIVGLDSLVTKLEGWQKMAANMSARGKDPRQNIPFTFVFKGPPGSGKTTVARRIAGFYYQIGILSSKEFVECSAADLVGQYVGQSAPKTRETLRSALGKVLFIDEAYRLQDSQFGVETVNEIVDCLTKPDFIGKLVVILAGYTDEINDLLRVNPGLASRFPEEIFFENLAPTSCISLLYRLLKKAELEVISDLTDVSSAGYRQVTDVLEKLIKLPTWGNGRDITTLSKKITAAVFQDATPDSSAIHVNMGDILKALYAMLVEQQARATKKENSSPAADELKRVMRTLKPPTAPTRNAPSANTSTAQPAQAHEHKQKHEENQQQEEANAAAAPTEPVDRLPDGVHNRRDHGVSDQKWDQLQRDAAAEEELAKQAQANIKVQEQAATIAREQAEALQRQILAMEAMIRQKQAAEDAKARAEADDIRRRLEQERIRAVALKRARDAEEARLRARREAERERQQQEQAVQKKLRDLGVCVAGFQWTKQTSGYRCTGGSHFVDNASLGL